MAQTPPSRAKPPPEATLPTPSAHYSPLSSTSLLPAPANSSVELPSTIVDQFIEPEDSTRPKCTRITSRWLKDFYHNIHLAHDTPCTFEGLSDLDESMTLREALAHPSWKKPSNLSTTCFSKMALASSHLYQSTDMPSLHGGFFASSPLSIQHKSASRPNLSLRGSNNNPTSITMRPLPLL